MPNVKHCEIVVEGQVVQYYLEIKAIKHYYMKVKDDQIIVSVPKRYDSSVLNQFLLNSLPKLLYKHQKRISCYDLEEGYVDFLGIRYAIVFHSSSVFKVDFKPPYIHLYDQSLSDLTIQKLLKKHLYLLEDRFLTVVNKHPEFKYPTLKCRLMTTKWGVYATLNHTITLNTRLLHVSPSLIDYVIYHECCHYFEANHSKRFYHRVGHYLSDHKQRQNALKQRSLT